MYLAHQVVAKRAQAASAIVQRNARGTTDQGIGHHGRQAARQKGLLAILPPAIDHVKVAPLHLGQEGGNVGRVILAVGVHRHNDRAPRVVKTGGKTGRLAEIAPEADHAQVWIALGQPFEHLKRAVPAAVVDGDDLIAMSQRAKRRRQLVMQRRQVGLFVIHGQDDGQVQGRLFGHCISSVHVWYQACVQAAWGRKARRAIITHPPLVRQFPFAARCACQYNDSHDFLPTDPGLRVAPQARLYGTARLAL